VSETAAASLLRHRSFILFWLARVASAVALQMQAVAVGWQVYDLTSRPLDLGLVGLAQFAPAVILIFVAGHLADRYDRRNIVRLSQAAEGLAIGMLGLATLSGAISTKLIFSAVFVIGAARAFEQTTLQTLIPGIVPAPLLPRAIAATSSATQTATIAGPAIGGLLYAVGPSVVYATCAVLFGAASLMISRVHAERTATAREPVTLTALFAGIKFIRHNPVVFGAISLDMFAVLLGGATALLPVFARDIFHTGPLGLGLLRASPAVGALTMSIVLARWPLHRHVGRTMFAGVTMFGIATIVFGLSDSFLLSMAALALIGASDNISVVIRLSLVTLETPDEMRGRVSAVSSLFVGTSNQLGEFESGLTAELFGTVPSVLMGGIGTLLVVLLWTRVFPALYRVETFAESRKP
jgi:MFS family permease